jgi:hypothetical protein
MVSFVVSGKAPTQYCTPRTTMQSPSIVMMGIYSRLMANACQRLKLFLEPNPQDFEEVDVLDFLEL